MDSKVNMLVLGQGGREHALADALLRSPRVGKLYCLPGNGGTASIAQNLSGLLEDFVALARQARELDIGLTVVGPEAPLCAGIVDVFQAAGLKVFGPTRAAARIEGDKAYAKQLMRAADVPTADFRVFRRFEDASAYVASRTEGVVVKASGLAGGKGVAVCPDPAEAIRILEDDMVAGKLGDAGRKVVVEELLKGPEISVFALVEGTTICRLETAQDYKRLGDGDIGPNTGGMGAFSPDGVASESLLREIDETVLVPTVSAMAREGHPFQGLLYAGLILTAAGPKVLEFNCRFGDPETQAVLPRLKSDLAELLLAVVEGRLSEQELEWDSRPSVCVVLASKGYPGPHDKGKVIAGLKEASAVENVRVFHAGTRKLEHLTLTDGGRVLAITGLGSDLADARRKAYEAARFIQFEGCTCRGDIGLKATAAADPSLAAHAESPPSSSA